MKPVFACVFLLAGSLISAAAKAQTNEPAKGDEIVVTAERSGVPVWRVRGTAGTLVLVGTIEEIAKGTNWNPDSLATALRSADQVMFPQGVQYTGGLLAVLRAPGKARKMERLPAGQTLANYLAPAQVQRLSRLHDRGLLKPGFETRRPLFVAYDLADAAKGERHSSFLSISRVDWKTDPDAFVRDAIRRYHLRLVPMRTESLNGALARIANTSPAVHVPCLLAAADFAEAGPSAFQARSQAWVTKRVRDVVTSPAEKAFTTCAAVVRDTASEQAIEASLRQALNQHVVTVAVLELSTLASSGAILDRLTAAGFEVSGPRWK
jgi:hypothetical protein